MNEEHLAKEAARLLNDETLAWAFEVVRTEALVALSTVDAENVGEVKWLQAVANCLPEVIDLLKAAIIAQGSSDGGMSIQEPTVN